MGYNKELSYKYHTAAMHPCRNIIKTPHEIKNITALLVEPHANIIRYYNDCVAPSHAETKNPTNQTRRPEPDSMTDASCFITNCTHIYHFNYFPSVASRRSWINGFFFLGAPRAASPNNSPAHCPPPPLRAHRRPSNRDKNKPLLHRDPQACITSPLPAPPPTTRLI